MRSLTFSTHRLNPQKDRPWEETLCVSHLTYELVQLFKLSYFTYSRESHHPTNLIKNCVVGDVADIIVLKFREVMILQGSNFRFFYFSCAVQQCIALARYVWRDQSVAVFQIFALKFVRPLARFAIIFCHCSGTICRSETCVFLHSGNKTPRASKFQTQKKQAYQGVEICATWKRIWLRLSGKRYGAVWEVKWSTRSPFLIPHLETPKRHRHRKKEARSGTHFYHMIKQTFTAIGVIVAEICRVAQK